MDNPPPKSSSIPQGIEIASSHFINGSLFVLEGKMNKIIALEIAIILSSKFVIIRFMVFFLNIQQSIVMVNTERIFFSSLLMPPI